MATEVVKIVDTGGTGDYSSLAAWEAGEQRDLVSADEIAIADCRCSSGSADTTAVTFDGWTTDSTHFAKLAGDLDTKNNPLKIDTSKYRLQQTGSNTGLSVYNCDVKIYNFQIITETGICLDKRYYATTLEIHKSILNSTNLSADCIRLYEGNTIIRNCVLYDSGTTSDWARGISFHSSNTTYQIDNNTIYNYNIGMYVYDGDVICRNNLVQEAVRYGYHGTYNTSSTNNLSNLNDAPGNNPQNGKTVTFVSTTIPDFHLDASDTAAKDMGADLSSVFTDDIDGETRSAPWDIGADEYVSGGGGQTALFEASLNFAASQQAVGHYSASLTSSVGLTGAQTSLAHLLAALSGSTDLSEQLQALAHLQGQLSSTAHLEGQSSGLRHRQGQLTSTTNFQDQLAGLAHLQATLSASLDVSSPITMTASLKGQLSSSLTLTGTFETVGAATALFTSVITLNESLETKASLLAAISDTLTLGAISTALASLKGALTSTFGLSSEFSTQLIMALSAALELGASTEALGHFLASLSDSLIATDLAEVTVHYKLNLSDNLSLGEQITAAASYIMMLTDALGLSALVRDVTVTASGVVTITFNAENPGVSFSAGCPGATFSGKGPNESFS